MPGKLFSAPTSFDVDDASVLAICATRGVVFLLAARDGTLLTQVGLDGECYSSPVLIPTRTGLKLLVGCRDDHLHAFDVAVS